MTPIYRRAAAADIARVYARYERERKGLGEEFLAELRATAARVVQLPSSFPIIHRQTRRAPVHRFPYRLFYRVIDETVVFVACFHVRRDPALWQRRR